jgi:hypothetical protein
MKDGGRKEKKEMKARTHFLALFPAPCSLNPLAKGLLSIFSWVI